MSILSLKGKKCQKIMFAWLVHCRPPKQKWYPIDILFILLSKSEECFQYQRYFYNCWNVPALCV